MIEIIRGNLFDSKAELLVNTVNCLGISGKGIALEFKKRFPDNYLAYRNWCKEENLHPGEIFVYICRDIGGPKCIVNFATKDHWRNPSRIEWVERGLGRLKNMLQGCGFKSIAIPPLGCGNGGLDWGLVKPLIIQKLEFIENCRIEIYESIG